MPRVLEQWNQRLSEELQSRDNNIFHLHSYDSALVSRTPTISGPIWILRYALPQCNSVQFSVHANRFHLVLTACQPLPNQGGRSLRRCLFSARRGEDICCSSAGRGSSRESCCWRLC